MSLGNIAHPSVKQCADTIDARYPHGRPDHELVPSRYALKVGAIDVLVISGGCARAIRRIMDEVPGGACAASCNACHPDRANLSRPLAGSDVGFRTS